MPEIILENSIQGCHTTTNNVSSQREYFNYLRNNSSDIFGVMTWGTQQVTISNQANQRINRPSSCGQNQKQYTNRSQQKKVTFNQQTRDSINVRGTNTAKQISPSKKVIHETNKRSKTAVRRSKIQKNVEEQQKTRQQNRAKVKNYIEQLKPFSRNLTNTKFQEYYQKAAPQCYGRANINEPIGGIIYGNHLKTYNMNPHSFTNNPQFYQTQRTALNYGKRTKINQQGKWKRLQRQLTKKLGLKDKNQTIKQGKQVVYVDVNDDNMYDVMRQNHQFQKQHKQEIHQLQLQFKKQKQQQQQDEINQFYAKKQDLLAEQLERKNQKRAQQSNNDYDVSQRLNQQVIYRYHDQKGNIRYGADRHALTNFVDMNFPQNDAVYTQELKSRMPISPTKVKNKDKNIDQIRKDNYFKSKEQVYPPHYLLRNCEEPEVLKMLSERSGVKLVGNRINNNNQARLTGKNTRKNQANMSTAQSTKNQQEREIQNESDFIRNEEQRNLTKSQIMNRAFDNPQIAQEIGHSMNQTYCGNDNLPNNEKNPRCYKNVSQKINRVPFAG